MRHASLAALLTLLSAPALAQSVTPSVGEVVVHHDDAGRVRGRIVDLGPQGLVLIAGNQRLTLPVAGVQRIDTPRDPVWDGALKGALIGGIWCALVCGQGLDDPGDAPLVVLAGAGYFAAAGAGIDALHSSQKTLYRRGTTASVMFSLEF